MGLQVSWFAGQVGVPRLPGAVVVVDGHRNNGCQVSQLVADPEYQGEKKPCDLDVDAAEPDSHYRQHTAI